MDEVRKSNHLPQWSFKTKCGKVLELAQYLPKIDGVFINPSKEMRNAIKDHYPEYLDEYDEIMKKRTSQIDNLLKLIQ